MARRATPVQAYGIAKGQLAYYHSLERQGHARIIRDAEQLNRHMHEWATWDSRHKTDAQSPNQPLGFVISMEGADPILGPEQLEEWWQGGLRLLGLTHYGPAATRAERAPKPASPRWPDRCWTRWPAWGSPST